MTTGPTSLRAVPTTSLRNNPVRHYVELLQRIEQTHYRLRALIELELRRRGDKVNANEAMLLFRLGDRECRSGDLHRSGCYLGSNVSYTLNSLCERGLIERKRSNDDQRASIVKVSAKGREIAEIIGELFDEQTKIAIKAGHVSESELISINAAMRGLERFLADQLLYPQ